jgi:hypothetical protein
LAIFKSSYPDISRMAAFHMHLAFLFIRLQSARTDQLSASSFDGNKYIGNP